MTLLELLQQERVSEFNERRGSRSTPDLFAADLAGRNLSGVDLSGANLEKADLSEADLSNAVLMRTNLNGADLTGANLTGAVMVRCKLREAYMDQVKLGGADLSEADLTEAVLTKSSGEGVLFRKTRLVAAEVTDVNFPGAQFVEARLDKADFSGSDLSGGNFTDASLGGATFERCVLAGADLSGARASNTSFLKAELSKARFYRTDLTAASLQEADLTGAYLVEADMADAELEGAITREADFTRARMDCGSTKVPEHTDKPANIQVEDPQAAVSGDRVLLFWENEDDEKTLVNRVVAIKKGNKFRGKAPALPAPAELVLARGAAATAGGFVTVALLERPSGTEVAIAHVGLDGKVGNTSSHQLDYEPAVAPVIAGGDVVRIFGIGRRGPTLHVHRVTDEGLEREAAARASTARGMIGNLHPMLVTRGGVLQPISAKGLGSPLSEPTGFSPRAASSGRVGDRHFVAWLPEDQKGFRVAELVSGRRPDVDIVDKKKVVTAVEVAAIGDRALAIYSREEDMGRCAAWGVWLDDLTATPFEVLTDPAYDIDTLRVVGESDKSAVVLFTTLSEDVVVVELKGERAKKLLVLP
ncbi:MAG: pentapeptide repeat-containing protein [Proteobacteria bacterium]|nr:pentapeptide repeat-containing protein [Pseudomonadota bacterium]MCP4915772.1 pentapeptide repeat-containing protein [Pseudomonadota bacterium]